MKPNEWLQYLRRAEFEDILHELDPRPKVRILEIGGGDGYLAKLLQGRGYDVVSTDPVPREPSHYPVKKVAGNRLPFPDHSFDRIFSSNVLEHVSDLDATISELRRILRPEGHAVHVMPTPIWRLGSIIFTPVITTLKLFRERYQVQHLPALPKQVLTSPDGKTKRASIARRLAQLGKRLIVPTPHGVFRSAFAEVKAFSPEAWKQRFADMGWSVKKDIPSGLFYIEGLILPGKFISLRKYLARHGMAGCHIYKTYPN